MNNEYSKQLFMIRSSNKFVQCLDEKLSTNFMETCELNQIFML
jgi:hypothetical protein